MKTTLPKEINSVEQAKTFLTELVKNDEQFHPEDDATDLVGDAFTKEEGEQLNKLMRDIYNLDGNNGNHATPKFDPCEFILSLESKEITEILISQMKFSETNTGGGCKALQYIHDNGYILITDEASLPESMDTKISVGFYNNDGECIGSFDGCTLQQLVNAEINIRY